MAALKLVAALHSVVALHLVVAKNLAQVVVEGAQLATKLVEHAWSAGKPSERVQPAWGRVEGAWLEREATEEVCFVHECK